MLASLFSVFSLINSPIGRWVLGGLGTLLLVGAVYWKGHVDGSSKIQAQWDAALVTEAQDGQKIRDDAQRDTAGDPSERVLHDDPRNRDTWKK